MPVPTAVPPRASRYMPFSASSMRSRLSLSIPAYPDHSWPSVIGVASCMWVRPIFTMSFHSSAFAAMASRRPLTAGSNRLVTFTAEAMYMVVGVHRRLAAQRSTRELAAAVGYYLVDVHVELGAAAGHPHMQRKHVVMLPGQDLVAGLHD